MAKYPNGAKTLENYLILPQGGVYRAYGSRFVAEVKNSAAKTRLLPFIFSQTDCYVLEFGNMYIRFYKNGAQIQSGPGAYEIASPYTTAELFNIHITQSADVLYLDHASHTPKKLSRVSDTSWTLSDLARRPPPTEEDNTDIGTPANATLTPAATTGTGIIFTASAACFLPGDVDRNLIAGSARAAIVTFTDTTHVVCDILDDFPNTAAIAKGSWFIDKSPSSYLDPDKHTQLGGTITLDAEDNAGAGQDTFRATVTPTGDVNKYIKILGGIVYVTSRPTVRQVKGVVRVALKTEDANPKEVPGGDWTLEVEAWTTAKGWPRTPFFFQGRLGHAGRPSGSFILSASDDFENYGVGNHADSALQYTIARQQSSIVWCADLGNLVIATPESIFGAFAPGTNQPLGGDVVPMVVRQDAPGSLAVQPVVTGVTALYIESNGKRLRELRYSPDQSQRTPYVAVDLTLLADHISSTGFAQEQIGWAESPNRHAFVLREDGVMAALTYFNNPENVVGWSRRTTEGAYESNTVIWHPDGNRHQAWQIVKRTINGATKRYIEYFEDNAVEFTTAPLRAWTQLFTDCAKVYSGAAISNVAAGYLTHLEGCTVDVIADGMYKGQKVVSGGRFTVALQETATKIEIGLHYDSTVVTMKPNIEGAVIRDAKKHWRDAWLVLENSIGGSIKSSGSEEQIVTFKGGDPMDAGPPLFTGDVQVPLNGIDQDGRLTIYQRQPYPHTILGVFGALDVSTL